jgi:hypothetical protein
MEEEPTEVPNKWLRQPSRSRDDMRHHVEVHAPHREKEWESQSASLIEKDPEVTPDKETGRRIIPSVLGRERGDNGTCPSLIAEVKRRASPLILLPYITTNQR